MYTANGYLVNVEPHEYHGRVKAALIKANVNVGDVIKYNDFVICVTEIRTPFYVYDKFPTLEIVGRYWNERKQEFDIYLLRYEVNDDIYYRVLWKDTPK